MAAKKEVVEIKCRGAGEVALEMLTPLQGRLKILTDENYKKLKTELLGDGFIEPISTWEDPDSGTLYILNGHQRAEALRRMKAEGYSIPQIPINVVEADSLEDAKQKILALASQYGVVDQQGLFEFASELGIDAEEFRARYEFADFNTERFLKEHFGSASGPSMAVGDGEPTQFDGEDLAEKSRKQSGEIPSSDFSKFKHKCPRCQFEFD